MNKLIAIISCLVSVSASANMDLSGTYQLYSQRIGKCPNILILKMDFQKKTFNVKWDNAPDSVRPLSGELLVTKSEKWTAKVDEEKKAYVSDYSIHQFGRWDFNFRDSFMKIGNGIYFERYQSPMGPGTILKPVCFYTK